MLLTFSVENFRSIRDLQTLSMVEPRLDHHLEWSHVFEVGNRRLLKSAAIFGPNASGKSNVLRAMIAEQRDNQARCHRHPPLESCGMQDAIDAAPKGAWPSRQGALLQTWRS